MVLVLIVLCSLLGVLSWAAPKYTLRPLSRLLVYNEEPEKADAIVVLLGGNRPDRILRAFELFRANYANQLTFCSGSIGHGQFDGVPKEFVWLPSSYVYRVALQSLGVPPEVVKTPTCEGAYDTYHELAHLADYARENHWQKVLLVTSPGHSFRVHLIWTRTGGLVEGRTIAADPYALDNWWQNGEWRREVAYEYLSLIKELYSQAAEKLQLTAEKVRGMLS